MLSPSPQRSSFHATQSCEGDLCTLLPPLWKTWWQTHSSEHPGSWHWSPPWHRQPEENDPNMVKMRKKSNIQVKGTKILVTMAKDMWTNLAVFAEERLQISCPGGWGQAADPQVLARCSSTPSSYMQDKINEQTLTEGSERHRCPLKSHLLTLFIFWLSLMIFSLRTTDRKTRSYKHSSGDTGDI